jgi:anti-sigma factor RsiW
MSHVDEGALHAYIDGELPPAERVSLETHVAACSACRARLADERALVERASQLLGLAQPLERPAPPLHTLRQPPGRQRLRLPLAWAASIALALSVGYYLRGPTAPTVVATAEDRAAAPAQSPPPAPARQPRERRQINAPVQVADQARVDSAAPTAPLSVGAISARPQDQMRSRVAAAVPGVAPRVEVSAGETDWPLVRREQVRQMLGTEPVGVPTLPVRSIRRDPAGDGGVLVEQELDSTTVIQLFERPATATRAASANPAARRFDRSTAGVRENAAADRLARFVGSLRVEIAGPLSQDSLNRLLEQVQPLP